MKRKTNCVSTAHEAKSRKCYLHNQLIYGFSGYIYRHVDAEAKGKENEIFYLGLRAGRDAMKIVFVLLMLVIHIKIKLVFK